MNLNSYVQMISNVYLGGTNNHPEHNSNPHYWSILLKDIICNSEQFDDKFFLDFGCGKGRNVLNAHYIANWNSADGIDISENNINYCNATYSPLRSKFYKNNGIDLSDIESNKYNFVMSTIVLQHLCVYELRFNILKEIFRVMCDDGIFSFQMGFGDDSFVKDAQISSYYDNNYNALDSNGTFDVRISDPQNMIDDLIKIGFRNISYVIKPSWADGGHMYWIYFRANK